MRGRVADRGLAMTDITVPTLGESVTEATVAKWLKQVGESVSRDEPLVELETDKVTLEVNAAANGVLSEIAAAEGATVNVGGLLGRIGDGAAVKPAPAKKAAAPAAAPAAAQQKADAAPAAPPPSASTAEDRSGPAARKLMAEKGVQPADVAGTGKDGRITKGDVLAHVEKPASARAPEPAREAPPPAPVPRETGPREQR